MKKTHKALIKNIGDYRILAIEESEGIYSVEVTKAREVIYNHCDGGRDLYEFIHHGKQYVGIYMAEHSTLDITSIADIVEDEITGKTIVVARTEDKGYIITNIDCDFVWGRYVEYSEVIERLI